jgi:hypothetical protein
MQSLHGGKWTKNSLPWSDGFPPLFLLQNIVEKFERFYMREQGGTLCVNPLHNRDLCRKPGARKGQVKHFKTDRRTKRGANAYSAEIHLYLTK